MSTQGRVKNAVLGTGRFLLVLLGAVSFAVAVKCFFIPNGLLSGGITGTALLLQEFFHLPVGIVVMVLNIPIFALGFRVVGRRFAIYSVLALAFFWVLVDYVPFPPLTGDKMLAGVFGGVFGGIGTALALRGGGSLGGFDILGVVLNRRYSLGVGEVLLALNGALIAVKGVVGTPELAMYTLLGIFVTSRTLDALQTARPRKAFLIVSRHAERIRDRVLNQMHRGLTILNAEGGFAHDPTHVLLVVVRRQELRELQEIVRDEDRSAFVVVLEASEVMGYFRTSSTLDHWIKESTA